MDTVIAVVAPVIAFIADNAAGVAGVALGAGLGIVGGLVALAVTGVLNEILRK